METFDPTPEPPRNAIPKVIGILMIIFGALVFFGNGVSLLNRTDLPLGGGVGATLGKISLIFGIIDTCIGGFEAYVGIRLFGYKDTSPKQANIWAALNIVSTILYMLLMFLWLKPKLAGYGPMADMMFSFSTMLKAFFAVAWSVVVAILVSTRGARGACTNY